MRRSFDLSSGGTGGALLDALKDYPLFSTLTRGQLKEVAEAAQLKDFGRGQTIIRQGDDSTTFHIIVKGLVEVKNDSQVLTRLGPGRFFGETALVSGSAYMATAIAVEASTCMALGGAELRSYPAVVVKILAEATHRNRAMVLQRDLGADPKKQLLPVKEEVVGFKSVKSKALFDSLVKSFTEDYMMKRRYLEQAGWRTIGELSAATRIPHATLYGKHGGYGPLLGELLSRGLVEARVFSGQRGRGGEVLRVRVAYDKEPIKRYVDSVVLKGRSESPR
jgi:hypothetical protein